MNEMIEFSIAILNAVVDFVSTPPIFYLFCLVCFIPIVVIVKTLIRNR